MATTIDEAHKRGAIYLGAGDAWRCTSHSTVLVLQADGSMTAACCNITIDAGAQLGK